MRDHRSVEYDGFYVVNDAETVDLARDGSSRFRFQVPLYWKSPVSLNPHAKKAEQEVIAWFSSLGCNDKEIKRIEKFDVAGYVGIPFPNISREITVRIGKFLSMWLLWDDVQIECLQNGWRIDADHVLKNRLPQGATRFDRGWWQLFQEFAARRSSRWIEDLCRGMTAWTDAAIQEARIIQQQRAGSHVPHFATQLQMRMATIGMRTTVDLFEDAYDFELPRELHAQANILELKKLSDKIVGLGNDIFSLGKDIAEQKINLVSTLMQEECLSLESALERLIRMHDLALKEYDVLSCEVGNWGQEAGLVVERWLQDIRYASLGFTLWEAQAPRYTSHRVVVNGKVIEPQFDFVAAPHIGALANAPRDLSVPLENT
jgi:hypothetical protein